jgi:hypothetical protein
MSPLEKKLPFAIPVCVCTVLTTMAIMDAAGIGAIPGQNVAQMVLYFFCFFGVSRAYSFLGWLLVLWISPATITGKQEPRNA